MARGGSAPKFTPRINGQLGFRGMPATTPKHAPPRGEQHSPSGRTNTTVSRDRIPWAPPGMCPQSMGGSWGVTQSSGVNTGDLGVQDEISSPPGSSPQPSSSSECPPHLRALPAGFREVPWVQQGSGCSQPAPGTQAPYVDAEFLPSSGEIPQFFQFMHRPECVCATLSYFCPISSVHDHFPLIPPCSSSWREILPNQDLVLNPLRNPLIQLD